MKIIQEIRNKLTGHNNPKTKKNENKQNNVKQKNKGNKVKIRGEWDWKKTPPKEWEEKTKEYYGKTYHWCNSHAILALHDSETPRNTGFCKKKQMVS